MQLSKFKFLSGNALKILAAIFMLADHIGVLIFPRVTFLRIIGRLSYPIFAFMISEGARYTKNKSKYFASIFSLAALCQIVYYFFAGGSLYMCILVTFSISILLIYAMNAAKRAWFNKSATILSQILLTLIFLGGVLLTYFLNQKLTIDYGFVGCVAPVFASIFDFRGIEAPEKLKKLDNLTLRTLVFAIPILLLAIESPVKLQYFGLLSILLLLLYSGARGKYKMKNFFYIFYPTHLVLIEAVYIVISQFGK